MSALKKRSNSLAGLTLDAVLGGEIVIPPPPPPPSSSPPSPPPFPQKSLVPHQTTTTTTQTLFDIIRDEYNKEGQKDRTTWQIFREKLRLKRTGSAWTTSLPIPASDILIPIPKHLRLNNQAHTIPMSDPPGRGAFTRGPSMRVGSGKNHDDSADVSLPGDGPPSRSFKPQFSRHDSVREHGDGDDDKIRRHPVVKFVDERQMSAREAVAAQEAAEAEAAAAESDDEEEEDDDGSEGDGPGGGGGAEEKADAAPKQTMSLMDLLEETDRQMGLTGASYAMDDEEEEYDEEEEEEEEDGGGGGGEGEVNCCVCHVNFKGATSTPCGHTFCKLCSKELMAQKGHCPVCSSFVLEFLEIF